MNLLDPILGDKLRSIITTLFACFIVVQQSFDFGEEPWAILVAKIVAVSVACIQILTHGTDVGDVDY